MSNKNNNDWISVKERVPVNNELVLVSNNESDFDTEHWVCAGEINSEGFWCNQFNPNDTIIVTHWMPFPKPPKKRK